jgi:RNA polymerase subunit RPABC4/transcription elongation factor Spt4
MGIFGDLFQRAKDELKYSAESGVRDAIHGSIEKVKTKNTGNKCPKCKKIIVEDIKFCQSCGEKLKRECKKCQMFFSLETKFCSECGNTLR